ncbi:MAG: helix-turn-helix transcriptional regulator [Bacillota bacterium]
MTREKHSTRREILTILKKKGRLSVDELSHQLGITPMGVRQHLAILERDDLVTPSQVRRGIGRPSHLYSLTEAAQDLFPKHYEEFAINLINDLIELGGQDRLQDILELRVQRISKELSDRWQGLGFEERVREFGKMLDTKGSMGEVEKLEDGAFAIREFNCGIYKIAQAHPIVCEFEKRLVERALGCSVQAEECIANGAQRCCYVVRAAVGAAPMAI